MSRFGFIAYGAGVMGITLLFARETIDATVYIYEEHAGDRTALAVTGWLISTVGPLALSIIGWLMAKRIKAQWLLHITFIPAAIAVFMMGASLFFYATGVSSDSMVGAMTMLAATSYLGLALLVHIIALAVAGVAGIKRWVNGN